MVSDEESCFLAQTGLKLSLLSSSGITDTPNSILNVYVWAERLLVMKDEGTYSIMQQLKYNKKQNSSNLGLWLT